MPCARSSPASGCVVGAPAALLQPVGGGDPEEQRLVIGPHLPHGVHDLEGEADTVLVPAAVRVGAAVGVRGEELVDEVSGGAWISAISKPASSARRAASGELAHDLPDPGHGQLGRHRVPLVEGQRARSERLPAVRVLADRRAALPGTVGGGLAAAGTEPGSRARCPGSGRKRVILRKASTWVSFQMPRS